MWWLCYLICPPMAGTRWSCQSPRRGNPQWQSKSDDVVAFGAFREITNTKDSASMQSQDKTHVGAGRCVDDLHCRSCRQHGEPCACNCWPDGPGRSRLFLTRACNRRAGEAGVKRLQAGGSRGLQTQPRALRCRALAFAHSIFRAWNATNRQLSRGTAVRGVACGNPQAR
jgi:hypothetical protein